VAQRDYARGFNWKHNAVRFNLTHFYYIGYKEDLVRRLTVPELDALEPVTVAEAARLGLMPAIGNGDL
jgi:hypothetical protein